MFRHLLYRRDGSLRGVFQGNVPSGVPVFVPNGKLLANVLRIDLSAKGLIGTGSYGNVYMARMVDVDQQCAVKLPKRLLELQVLIIDPHTGALISRLQHTKEEGEIIKDLADEIDYSVLLTLGRKELGAGISRPNNRIGPKVWSRASKARKALEARPGYWQIHHIYEFDKEYIPCLVSRRCEGTLFNVRHPFTDSNGRPTALWYKVINQVHLGLRYMHWQDVAHNDMKPENVLFELDKLNEYHFFVSDFGMCSKASKPISIVSGTPNYFSPELEQHSGQTLPVANDAFAFGKTCLVLLLLHERGQNGAVEGAGAWVKNGGEPPHAAFLCTLCRAPAMQRCQLFKELDKQLR